MSNDKEEDVPSVREAIREVKHEIRTELAWRECEIDERTLRTQTTVASDAPHLLTEDDVTEVSDNHFRVNMGRGFGLDVVLLDHSSLAFRSFDHTLLDLKRSDKGWPTSFFMPVVGDA